LEDRSASRAALLNASIVDDAAIIKSVIIPLFCTTTVLVDAGASVSAAARLASLLQVGGFAGAVAISRVVDRFRFRALAVVYAGAAAAVAGTGFAIHSHTLEALTILAAGFGIVGGQIAANALAAMHYPTALRSTGVGPSEPDVPDQSWGPSSAGCCCSGPRVRSSSFSSRPRPPRSRPWHRLPSMASRVASVERQVSLRRLNVPAKNRLDAARVF
jgi:hypothetical protein